MSNFLDQFDKEYTKSTKKKRKNIQLIIILLLTLLIISTLIFNAFNSIKIPNFIGNTVEFTSEWGYKNKVEIKQEKIYSNENAGTIIDQQPKKDTISKKRSTVVVKVSMGTDPNEEISLPDFNKKDIDETKKWIQTNNLENIEVLEIQDEIIEKNKFIKQEPSQDNMQTYKRKDKLKIYYSKGNESNIKNISIPNFKNKNKQEALVWAEKNGVEIIFSKIENKDVEKNVITGQEPTEGTKMSKQDILKIDYSGGKTIKVPNFYSISLNEIDKYNSEFTINVKELYSESIEYSYLISQSIEIDTLLYEDDEKEIVLIYSIGRPYIKSYTDKLEGDIPLIISEFNDKGANLTYNIYYRDSSEEKGKILETNFYNQYIEFGSHIIFWVSN